MMGAIARQPLGREREKNTLITTLMLREKEKPKTFLSRFVNGVVLILTRRERERERERV